MSVITAATVKLRRPEYSAQEAELVAAWINGRDRAIVNMVPESNDYFMALSALQQNLVAKRRYFKKTLF